jgi:hypothetical protein
MTHDFKMHVKTADKHMYTIFLRNDKIKQVHMFRDIMWA